MRPLVGILVSVGFLFGIYLLYLKRMPSTDNGTVATQAISLTGVRSDLLSIAQAERIYVTNNSRCASMDELVSSETMSVSRSGRDGYTYSVDCSGTEFSVTASHAPAPAGSPVRYPTLAIDQTMQVREVQ